MELGRERRQIGLVFLALRKFMVGWEGGNKADASVTDTRVVMDGDPRHGEGVGTPPRWVSGQGLGPKVHTVH